MLRLSFLLIPPLLLQACQSTQPDAVEGAVDAAGSMPQVRMITEGRVEATSPQMNVQLIADTLFEALQALDADRLLTPIDDNAHARFMRVLAYDRDNAIALQGLQDIVARYFELSIEASRRGLFEEAQQMLDRAIFVDGDHPGIAPTLAELQAEMNSGDLFFALDAGEFSRRSAAAEATLVDIAQQAREQEAFFLITAPNDDLARWMFAVMRGAVAGYRLRGNIELASRTTVRLRLPDADPMGC